MYSYEDRMRAVKRYIQYDCSAAATIRETGETLPKAIECLEEGLEESLQFFHFPQLDAYIRLVTSYMIEYSEEWRPSEATFSEKALNAQREEHQLAA